MRNRKENKMDIKTVKIGLANASYIAIPFEKILYIKFNGKDIFECDINALDRPNFKIRFRSDTGFFEHYLEKYDDWANSDRYGVTDVVLCFDNGGEKEIILPWKDNDTNSPAEYNHCEVTRHIGKDTVIEVDKFNIYGYINSDAIGRHCQKLMHKFSAAESAYIVNSSNRHTLREKHAMYNHIIETMPDEMIRTYTPAGWDNVSLHKTLVDYIKLQNKMIDDFNREEAGFVYSCVFYYDGDYMPEEHGPYRTVNDLFCDVESLSDDAIGKIEIKKISLSDRKYMEVVLNFDREPINVSSCFISEDEENLAECFDLMWFVCPTPFKKGDILGYHSRNLSAYTECFVLESLCYEGRDEEYLERRKRTGDSSDMTATGYFQNEDGSIYSECMHDYLSLEYFDGKLNGKLRILKALSMYIKGEIWADLFLNAYDVIMKEEKLKKAKDGLYYLDDVLKEIGISKEHGF